MNKKFYITTAIDYTNDVIHIGHAYQKILSDSLARYHRLRGDKTFFLTGTDEHGQKVQKAALEKGVDPQHFVDEIAAKDKAEWDKLNISYDRFIRTTDKDHVKFAQEFYLRSKRNGDIYLNKYEGLYCEGCEAYYDESDLTEGKCPFHPNREIIKLSEENYFFRLSKYQKFLEELVGNNSKFVIPEDKRKEILSFIKRGLKDFSISRKNVTWGIPVPDNPDHTIYVWFDALINYLTFGVEKKCWPADVHVLGKDNQRFHAIYWPAMLKSAGYELPKTILVHDFISLNGQKISKSLGNVILPSDLIKQFGTDGVRYFFLRYGPLSNDVDVTIQRIKDVYNSDLANNLGNLVARTAKLCETGNLEFISNNPDDGGASRYHEALENFNVPLAIEYIWNKIENANKFIDNQAPWKQSGDSLETTLKHLVEEIRLIATLSLPFIPETAEKIEKQFKGPKIRVSDPLFPRLI